MTFTRRLKRYLDQLFPNAAAARRAARSRRGSHRDAERKGHVALNRRLVDAAGTCVLSGPFAGLVLTPMTLKEHVGPALLGTYEAELHPWFNRLLRRQYPQIVDVGAKFGYYAVGLCRRVPSATSVAFDIDPWARRATREVARANGVTTLQVRAFANPAWFDRHLQPGALVVSDCEGFERELFPHVTTPAADSSTFVIEMHEAMAPGVTERLIARFAATHDLVRVPTRQESAVSSELRATLGAFTDEEIRILSDELRGGSQEWLIAVPTSTSPVAKKP
jgi:precorrin-6B methylase 2